MSIKKIAFVDFDSTLLHGETFDLLAQEFRPTLLEETQDINQKSVRGDIPLFDCIIDRAQHFKGLHLEDFKKVFPKMKFTPGAQELIKYFQTNQTKVVCLSGGFENVIDHAQKILGFDHYWANHFQTDPKGYLTGHVSGPMMNENSKGIMVSRLQKIFGFTPAQTIVVGDGSNDVSMFEHADYRIAFCAAPILKEKANIVIDTPDLGLAIKHLEEFKI